jgi:hypothetical protein
MNIQTKSVVLEYLTNTCEAKNKEGKGVYNQLTRAFYHIKYWLKGMTAIDFHVDMKNYISDLDELDRDIKSVIARSDANINVIEECLNHFESKSDVSVGKEYCINVLKSTLVRVNRD